MNDNYSAAHSPAPSGHSHSGFGPGTAPFRAAMWLNYNPRTWLTWCAIGAGSLGLLAIIFAAVWAALLPQGVSTTSVWVWGIMAAVYFAICAGLLLINASGHMPGWLAGILCVGGLLSAVGVIIAFFWAVLSTDTTTLLALGGCVVGAIIAIALAFALGWPMAESMRPWLYRLAGAEHPPGRIGRD